MAVLFQAGLNNAVWSAVLALAAGTLGWLWRRRPAVGHALWLIVLVKLVTPSLFRFEVPSATIPAGAATKPVAPPESRRPVSAARQSVDFAGGVSGSIAPRGEHPPGVSPERSGSVAISAVPSRPVTAWPAVPREIPARMAGPAVAGIWLAGAIVWWWVVALGCTRFRRLIGSARPAPMELIERIAAVAETLGLRSIPAAYIIPVRVPPMVWVPLAGPAHLVLPEELWNRLSAVQQDAVLAHELAHLRRRDHWVRRLETLACGLYWWDPIAWWARREVERAEERCCDAWVLWALPSAAQAYAEALVMTAVYLSGLRRPLPVGTSGAERLRPLKRRLHMILSDVMSDPVARKAPRALLVLGTLSLPLLPALALGSSRAAVEPATPTSAEQPAKAATTADGQGQKPEAVSAPKDQPKHNPPAAPAEKKERSAQATAKPPKVTVCQPVMRETSDYERLPAQISAGRQADLKARVSGTLVKVTCRPGQEVKEGELLFEIDSRAYRAELDKAQAELQGAKARLMRWSKELARTRRLVDQKSIGQEEADRVDAEAAEAAASLRAAEAVRDLASLKLESTRVTAPFAGTISGRFPAEGNLVIADMTHLATIITTNPVHVEFDVTQKVHMHMNRLKREGKLKGGSLVGLPVTLVLGDDEELPHKGKIDSVEQRIDPATGTSHWRAVVPNPDGLLLPGMFVTVMLAMSKPHKGLVVPEQALLTDQGQNYVFVLIDANSVLKFSVKVGPLEDGFRSVDGLEPDRWVVISNGRGLKDYDKVLPERVKPPARARSAP